MTTYDSYPRTEIPNNPTAVAGYQRALGTEWADLFIATDGGPQFQQEAEILLRNPAVYVRDLEKHQLPPDLEEKWAGLLTVSDAVATAADFKDREWAASASGLEKIQHLMYCGELNPQFRGSISDIMRLSSELFAESTLVVPGNTPYYRGNVQAVQSRIRHIRQVVAESKTAAAGPPTIPAYH